MEITDYRVDFGKYSKDNIAIVARNGSVVELNPSQATITDGQDQNTPEGDRAEGTIIGFAEGVWYNPRPAAIGQNNGAAITSPNQPVVTDGRAGQKYVPQFGSSVLIRKPMELGSKKAVAIFAKDGAKLSQLLFMEENLLLLLLLVLKNGQTNHMKQILLKVEEQQQLLL